MGKRPSHFLSFLPVLLIFLIISSSSVSAHRGRTDSRGGHIDHSTGEYHYHHGHSAHQHTDLDGDGNPDCPYNFDDQTGTHSGSSSSTSSSLDPSGASSSDPSADDSFLSNLPTVVNLILVLLIPVSAAAILSFVLAIIITLVDKVKKRTKR